MTAVHKLTWADIEGLQKVDKAVRALSQNALRAGAKHAINRTAHSAKTRVVRALAKQTGLKQKVLRQGLVITKATDFNLEAHITARGGDIALKHFGARETRRGVSARPFGQRKIFEGTFIRGGRFPGRVVLKRLGGQVFQRNGEDRLPIRKVKSGVIIPKEMVQGQSREAFDAAVRDVLPRRLIHEVDRQTEGAFR